MDSLWQIVSIISIFLFCIIEALPRKAVKDHTPLDFADLNTLKFVQVLHRHGDRNRNTDEGFYPNDPHINVQIGPKVKGQLTATGKANGFELGQYLRRRYDGFLSSIYSIDEIVATSSDVDRAVMTCQTLLAGLFPVTADDPEGNWNENLKWQPIPVHTISTSLDNMFQRKAKCAKLTALLNEEKNSSFHKIFDEKYQDFYQFLSKHSGKAVRNTKDAHRLIDILLVEKAHGLRLPSWTNEPGFWTSVNEIQRTYFRHKEGYTQSQRLRAGPLLTTLISNMENKRNETEIPLQKPQTKLPKMLVYSGHDSNLFSLLNVLGIPVLEIPPYTSAILVELHTTTTKNSHGQAAPLTDPFFVKIFYRNETTAAAHELRIPNYTTPYGLIQIREHFSLMLITPEEWAQECKP